MTLAEYLVLNPTATLASTQAYTETTDKLRIGSGQARGFFAQTGIWLSLKLIQGDLTHALFSLVDATIVTASDASSYFGMDMTKAAGVANMAGIDAFVAAGVMTAQQKLDFIGLSKKTTIPFATITQQDFDNAKLFGNLLATTVNYMGGVPYQVRLANKSYKLLIVFANTVPVDCVVTLTQRVCPELLDKTVDSNFILDDRPTEVFTVKTGATGASRTTNKPLGKHFKLKAECNYNLPFDVYVEEI